MKRMIQFITHYTATISYLESVRMALAGGCRWVQLRMKGASAEEVRPVAVEALRLCREAGATFIIDDRVELAKEIGADGVHLGKADMPVGEARRFLEGSEASESSEVSENSELSKKNRRFIIGGTANTFADVEALWRAGADYIGCGPFRFTTTKERLSPILGLEGYRQIISQMREAGITLPIVAIGGITAEDIPAIMQTGVTGIALSGAILRAENPVEEMRRMIRECRDYRETRHNRHDDVFDKTTITKKEKRKI